jgi:type II secretory pathway predicted ATPase ExeA
MYETFISLNKRPFAAVPFVEGYFPGTVCESARIALTRCIERGEGIGMLVGPVGTGKTLLCQKIADQFKNSFHVVFLTGGRISSRRSLFQAILYELSQPYRDMDEGELRLALMDYLSSAAEQKRGLLLLVDEAHTLPLRLLDELRMLTNLAKSGHSLVRLILSGSCALEERLADPKLDSFNSRIASRCYLEAFNRTETADYLRAKIDLTGGKGEAVFSDDACQSVYQATEGVPRLINQLCDHALLVASSSGRHRLEAEQIEEAWADLQQLPTPWNNDTPTDKPGVIEFGQLDDMPEEESADSIKMPSMPLRINAETDELDEFDVEPTERIDSIKKMINGAEAEFDPSSNEPEIVLSFDEFEHPFQETFEQEEVVTDRYTATPPRVSTIQSAVAFFRLETIDATSGVPETALETKNYGHAPFSEQKTAVKPVEKKKTPMIEAVAALHKLAPPKASTTEIVLEIQPAEEKKPLRPIQPVQPVRKNDFSRLFAKLRQG